ncbi:17113_t:CDS:2 [Funneliformis geosporum]|uniref:17113_t:CDS:1 n=1 Tax=Funneliformis geosporum TaxID=1117311 RepID=A0A9W4SCV9_9GLOM|nr:17113_t:CDS:2 [Funneliformis geosporum]
MYYKEEEEPNLSSYTWVLDENAPNTYASIYQDMVPINTEKKFIDLETFKAYDRPLQPYIIDSMIPNGSSADIAKKESPVVSIKQEESTNSIKQEEDGTHGGIQHLSKERGTPIHQSRYNGNVNGNGGGQEPFGSQLDSRSQQMSQSPRQQTSQQSSQVSPQHNDRPRPTSRRNTKFTRHDSWRDLERGVDGGGNLDRPVEEGELTNVDFVSLATGLNFVPHKKPRIE